MKKAIILFSFLLAGFLQMSGQTLLLDFGNIHTQSGDTINVPLMSTNFSKIVSLQFSINWQPEQLQFLNWENGALPTLPVIGDTESAMGNLKLSWFHQSDDGLNLSDADSLIILRFLVKSCREETILLDISDTPLSIEIHQINNDLPMLIPLESTGVFLDNVPFQVDLGDDQTFLAPNAITLAPACPSCSFLWSTGSTASTLTATESGIYGVTVTTNEGCLSMDEINIFITNDPLQIIPATNVLTPNSDGKNDVLEFCRLDLFNLNKLTIFNRWGDIIYENLNYQNDWNGTYKGEQLPAGTYYYILLVNGSDQSLKSSLTLIRRVFLQTYCYGLK